MIPFAVDIRRLIVPAGVRETIHFVGNTMSVLTAAVGANTDPDFRVGINDASPNRFRKALRYATPPGELFEKVTVENPADAAGPLTVEILIAQGDVSDERLNVVSSVLAVEISNVAALQAAADKMAAAADAGTIFSSPGDVTVGTTSLVLAGSEPTRRWITVQNIGSTTVRLGDGAVTMSRGAYLAPGGSASFETAGPIWAISSAAGGIVAMTKVYRT